MRLGPTEILGGVLGALLWAALFCHLARKAGYEWWWGLLCLIPLVNLIPIATFILGEWPIQRDLKDAQRRIGDVVRWRAEARKPEPGPGGVGAEEFA